MDINPVCIYDFASKALMQMDFIIRISRIAPVVKAL